jgi:RNA polymerase sigma-70 factor (ECF subfamily)
MNFSSEDFLKKIKDRDHEAITQLINSYNEALHRGALKQNLSFDQAEEVVQATWSTFYENVENFEGRSHIRTYLFGILYNKIKELWRSNKKYTGNYTDDHIEQLFNEDGSYLTPPQDPSDWIESNQFIEILSDVLKTLPPKQKMAFQLKEIDGEETQDICKILDVSVTNLGVLLYRAKASIRLKLEEKLSPQEKV